jgi:hypothetical protein
VHRSVGMGMGEGPARAQYGTRLRPNNCVPFLRLRPLMGLLPVPVGQRWPSGKVYELSILCAGPLHSSDLAAVTMLGGLNRIVSLVRSTG